MILDEWSHSRDLRQHIVRNSCNKSTIFVCHFSNLELFYDGGGKQPLKWFQPDHVLPQVRGGPVLSPQGDVDYISCEDSNLYAINSQDGELLWKFVTTGQVSYRTACALFRSHSCFFSL